MSGTVVYDPGDAAGVVVGRAGRRLLSQPVERCDVILRFAAARDSGVMHIPRGDVGPGTAAELLVFDMHGSAWPAVLPGPHAPTAG